MGFKWQRCKRIPYTNNRRRIMDTKKIMKWFIGLFFILAGLAAFGIAIPFANYLTGIFGVVGGVLYLLDK
jgi:hypothetical protein